MRSAIAGCCFIAAFAIVCPAQVNSDLKSLYKAQKWSELNDALGNTKGMPLYRGAIDVALNQDHRRAENMLLSVIRSAPRSEEAYEAYEWLSHLYFYRGQYQSLISVMEGRWAEFPNKEERPQEQAALAGFRGLPNQILEATRPSALNHESGSISFRYQSTAAPQHTFSTLERGYLA